MKPPPQPSPRFHSISRMAHLPNPGGTAHAHQVHELIIVLRGSYAVRLDDQRLQGGYGDTFYYPPGLRHVPQTTRASRGQLIIVQWQGEPPPQPRHLHDDDGRLRTAATWLWQLGLDRQATPDAVLDGLLLALLHQRTRAGAETLGDDLFDRARRYLLGDLSYRLSLAELAEAMGTSPASLQRCFVARTGQSPMRYRRERRVEAVLALLQAGDDRSLAELAAACGFANAYHLSRTVRDHSGRPPSAWRRR